MPPSKTFDRFFLFTSFANYPLSLMSTTTAKKKHSAASFPVVHGSFGYHVTCQTYGQPRSQVSLLREKGSERTLGERLVCRERARVTALSSKPPQSLGSGANCPRDKAVS